MRSRSPRPTAYRSFGWLMVIALLAVTVAACSHDDDEDETPTAIPPTATVAPTAPPAVQTLTDANGQGITDGLCQALVPNGWVDDGTGRGTSLSGARFVLFGGRLTSDAEWESAAAVVATPTSGREIESIQREADSVHVIFTDQRGFDYRVRFDDRYCDFTVYRSAGPTPTDEQAFWSAIIASLGPVTT